MKRQVEYYYLKGDTERKQPYKFGGIHTHFKTKETFVHFYSIRTDDPASCVLGKDEFLELFVQVVEEY